MRFPRDPEPESRDRCVAESKGAWRVLGKLELGLPFKLSQVRRFVVRLLPNLGDGEGNGFSYFCERNVRSLRTPVPHASSGLAWWQGVSANREPFLASACAASRYLLESSGKPTLKQPKTCLITALKLLYNDLKWSSWAVAVGPLSVTREAAASDLRGKAHAWSEIL